jgi:molecular chaperone DnaK (HSP70)
VAASTAAGLGYGLNIFKAYSVWRNVLIFDLGGGTLDISVQTIDNDNSAIEVLASNGNTHLGLYRALHLFTTNYYYNVRAQVVTILISV